jgi:hypothetical protein
VSGRLKYDPFEDGLPPKAGPKVISLPKRRKIDPFAPQAPEPVPEPSEEVSEPERPRPVRLPRREVDYRKALHDTDRDTLSSTALLCGLVICQRCWKSGELYASQATLAEWMHLVSTKSVRKAVAELEAAGFLTKLGTKGTGVLHYRLTVPVW